MLKDLEKILQEIDKELFDKYISLVNELEQKVYKNINESLAVEYGIYTNHDKKHFDRVVEQAGYLLQAEKILQIVYKEKDLNKLSCEEKERFFFLNSFELFILLCSIRVHDIALLVNREDHSSNIIYTTNLLNIEIERSIKKIIAEISGAHTGITQNQTKDKINELDKLTTIRSKKIRPQVLAAIVRFSDELEEGEHRTSSTNLLTEKIKKENIVFHKYSLAITDLSVDHDGSRISITFEIDENEREEYIKPNGDKVTLLKEIYLRLQKLEQERKYFHRFLCNAMSIESIESKIFFRDKYANLSSPVIAKTGDTYPGLDEYGLNELKNRIEHG